MSEPRSTAGFVHLHTHSEYSPIDSLAKVKDLVSMAAADSNPALAITDHGTLGGIWKLGQQAAAKGIKPIPGIEAYLAIGDRRDHNAVVVERDDTDPAPDGTRDTKQKRYEHLTLLAATRAGWRNLVLLTNASHESFWYKPRIDYDLLEEHSDGIIVLTGCLGGPVAGPLARGDRNEAVRNLRRLVRCVGPENVYVEVMDHEIATEVAIIDDLRSVAAEVGVPVVATNDSHYLHPGDAHAHEAWLAVGTKTTLDDPDRFRFHGTGYHLRTEAEMRALQGGAQWWQEACDATVAIAARIADDVLPAPKLRLPRYPVPAGFADSATYLRHLVREGAFDRYGADPQRPEGRYLPPAVNAQLKFEFSVVHGAGLDDYFLIVHDIIEWARSDRGLPTEEFPDGEPGKKKPIRVGPGRGSAAGSVISYCLKIVNVEPMRNGLLFERFLNPQRAGMPDVDVDFEQGRRPEVLRYIQVRFGRDRVARIGTFGAAASRAALKDAARVLGSDLGNRLSPLVPIGGNGKPYTFKALEDTADHAGDAFRSALAAAGAPGIAVAELARAFEGVTKQEGIHACGTLIADEPMAPLVPLRRDLAKGATDEDLLVTVWDGKDVDAYGLLKMDVLGLRNLDVISAAVRFIADTTGEHVDPDTLEPGNPADAERDAKAWQLIASGRTAGVFQLESAGMTKLAEQVSPNSLADLTALVALFRPGPLAAGMHEHYAARKNGREAVDYGYLTRRPDEQAAIASVLDVTYGTIVYQEQLMKLSEVVGGLEPGMRNKLQKAFSKKSAELMAEVKEAMFAGALAGAGTSGVTFSQTTLDSLWATFEGSAAYLFNASHACAYGFVAYQTAYLKANWPVQYGAALLSVTDDDDKRRAAIRSLQAEGITIHAPDINRSGVTTQPDADAVRLGLSEVKGVGSNATHIVAERDDRGHFTSLADALARVRIPVSDAPGKLGALPVNVAEALIEAGAFDEFGPRLGQAIIVRAARAHPTMAPVAAEWGVLERAARQRARLGLITGAHPLVTLREQVRAFTAAGQKPLSVRAVQRASDGERVMLLGVLAGWAEKPYKRGRMVTLTLEGSTESVEGVMWDEDRQRLPAIPRLGDVVALTAQVRVRIVETERIDDDGETVTESLERRDLTVKRVVTVPVGDQATLELPHAPVLVLTQTLHDAHDAPEEERPVASIPDQAHTPPVASPALDLELGGREPHQPLAAVVPLATPPASETPVDVLHLPAGSHGREHEVLRRAAAAYDLPVGFLDPAGGVWVLRTPRGRVVVVVVGDHEAPSAADLPTGGPGWATATSARAAAA